LNGKKVLVLGESHICGGCDKCGNMDEEDDDCRNFTTKNTIEPFLRYKKGELAFDYWMNNFTKFVNVFNNRKVDNEEIFKFWDSVVFYNFVQSSSN